MKMKKEYKTPQLTEILDVDTELLLGSVVDPNLVTGEGGEVDIDYGGVDEGGNKDPEAKQGIAFNVWEDNNPNMIYNVWSDYED